MSESLFDMNQEFKRLRAFAEEEELTEEDIKDTLEGMEDEWLEKMDSYVEVIKLLTKTKEYHQEDIARSQRAIEVIDNNIERMKKAMFDSVKMRYEGDTSKVPNKKKYKFWTQKTGWSIDEIDNTKVPVGYLIPQEPKIDKKALLDDCKKLLDEEKKLPEYVTLKKTEFITWR